MADPVPPKPPKHRSPNYPAYGLEAALKRASELQKLAGTHPANVSTVIHTWGYTPKSSKGILMLASIKRFALAQDSGRGDARTLTLTPLGRELVYYDFNRESDEWKQRAQTAALTPAIHRELWTRYSGLLPTDAVMKDYLVLERGFSVAAAEELLSQFRRTLAFAGIGDSAGLDILPNNEGEDSEELDSEVPATPPPSTRQPSPAAAPAERTPNPGAPLPVNVNLSGAGWATLKVSSHLTEEQWKQLMDVLQAMKPGLMA